MTWRKVSVLKSRSLYAAAACACAIGVLAWGWGSRSGSVTSGAEAVQPLLLLDGRSYAIVSLEPPSADVPPVMVLRDESSGRLERRWALIQVRLEESVALTDVLADLPVAATQETAPGTFVLRVPPEAFSRVHRTLLTDWRVARLAVPLTDQQGLQAQR